MKQEAREVRLARRPEGFPTPDDFTIGTVELPEPGEGEIAVRNTFISVDPYMRGRMNDVKSYVPPFALGAAMEGGAVGVVESSRSDGFAPGDTVLHQLGWRDAAVLEASQAQSVDPSAVSSPSHYLGALGMPGLTAYVGLLDVAEFSPGETVFVSGAAGAVGQMVGQIAQFKGAARVVGSAGSQAKVDYLTDRLGFDAAFNYRDAPVADQLRAAAPHGVDIYFDNVGGDHLEAAIGAMKLHGRVAVCGAISQYNATEPSPGPRNLAMLIGKRLSLRGFLVYDHFSRMGDFVGDVGAWIEEGRIVAEETVVEGLDNAPEAFVGMLRGENLGKMVVKI